MHAGADLPSKTRRLFEPAEDGWLRVAASRVGSEPARARLVETVAEIASSRRARDPALRALLKREQDERTRGGALRLPPSQVQRSLRGFHLSLYPYQLLAVEKFLGTGRMLLADDMGLGKTVQAAAIGHVLADTGKVRRTLVLAPASLKHQWVSEWRRATDVPIEPVEGTPEMRQHQYGAMSTGVLVANYEQVFRDLELMQGWGPELVILDEAQRIKNWATLTARQVKQLDVPYRLVLTGTPLENRLDELASIMDWVDPSVIAPKWRLGPAHSVLADGANEIVGVQRLDALRTRLAPRMLRRRRAEVLSELPERTDTVRRVAMTPAQRIEHDDLCQPIAQLVQAARRRGLTQAQFLRLMSLLTTQRIIANGMAQLHFSHTWPGLHDRLPEEALMAGLSMPKLDHIRELIESVVLDQHRKVVVFSQWRRALCLANWSISDILGRQGLRAAFFTGKESQRRRTQNVIEFHDDPALRVLFCSDAGGVGLNLQRAASCCINFELPWNPAVLEQRIARIHRLGQSDPVDVYTLVSENSIEAKIASVVTDKRALFTGLFDGDTDEIQFDGAGSFLGAVQAVVDPAAQPADSGGSDVDDVEPADDPRVDEVVSSGDERLDPPPAEARGAATLPPVDEVRQLFSQLRVNTRPDGGVVLEAPAEAAQTLGALFSGMAALLEQAAGPSASR